MQRRGVVVTGLGVVSPIGIGLEDFRAALAEGRSGVRRLPLADEVRLPVEIGGELPDFDPKAYVKPRKSMKLMCREIQIGFAAAELAAEHAGIGDVNIDRDRFGVVYGSDMLYCDVYELAQAYQICMHEDHFVFNEWGVKAINALYPLWMLKYLPNMTACHVGIRHDARGPNNTITLTETSSLLAIAEAANVIERGDADLMIAGGVGSRLPINSMLYRGAVNVSKRFSEPEAASRPFDRHRDGMVIGEGGAALILESEEHARSRGAKIWAHVCGWGSSFLPPVEDKSTLTVSIANSIKAALRSAEAGVDEVGHVNAHGLSTVAEDRREAEAIHEVLGDVPVTALKSYFGNLGAGGGAVEAVASLLALDDGEIPATLNTAEMDDDCPINLVRDTHRPEPTMPSAVLLNQSYMGQSAALVVSADG